jgi:hypothetical protein
MDPSVAYTTTALVTASTILGRLTPRTLCDAEGYKLKEDRLLCRMAFHGHLEQKREAVLRGVKLLKLRSGRFFLFFFKALVGKTG